MNRVFSRHVNDALEAEEMAQAMLRAGCEVISIAFAGMHRGAMGDIARFVVFGCADTRDQIDEADETFRKWLNSLTPQPLR